jgi:8-oxo-dGTP diphosphatase
MRQATLCFPLRGHPPDRVLLGYKKAGFGAGKYNGFGGKVQAGETITAATARELTEEAGIRVPDGCLQQVAHLTFRFPAMPAWDQVVHVFVATEWEGQPVESREMIPHWFAASEIPFERMWADDRHWLPRILAGEGIRARFVFQDDNETIAESEIETWDGGALSDAPQS